ncbi:hypothetical protein H6P81_000685 [Aristolochia fimbriata]|uniref:Histone-lysine N-methyltransferase n=1 Tax=Aristolochia fimbriata TaxID=158543 RepID=A0AAV7F858_ARIFI|nr:hypothetical protein H6P81_000685 [Aristolochia fimbriata]
MDGSWQIKCTSSWPAATSSLPPPARNQADLCRTNYFHPYADAAQEASSVEHAFIQEPLVYNTLNFSSTGLSRPDIGNSFLSLLSGSKQPLHRELAQHLNPSVSSSSECGVPGVWLASHHPKTDGIANGDGHRVDLHQVTVVNNNSRIGSCEGFDYTKAVLNHAQQLSLGQGQNTDVASSSVPHAQMLTKTTYDAKSASVLGPLRVFCQSTCGDLLLNDMGFLGVRCLCHGFNMSVLKFCEHSGSFTVNPGEAVQLETGETIAQWRRLYFLKFGIRVPDDTSGWDWANGMSTCGGPTKSNLTVIPSSFKNSNTYQPLDSFGGTSSSKQPLSDFISYKDTGDALIKNIIHSAEKKNNLIGPIISRSFVDCPDIGNTGQASVNSVADSCGHKLSAVGSSGKQSLVAPSGVNPGAWEFFKHALDGDQQTSAYHQNVTDYINFISKGSRSFNANQNLRNLKPSGMDSVFSKHVELSRQGFVMDRKAAQSNIELRLGQPSQQTIGIVGPVPFRSESLKATCHPQKPQVFESCVQTAVHPRVTENSLQNFRSVPSDPSTSIQKEKAVQLNHMHRYLGSTAIDYSKIEQLKGIGPTKNPLPSAFLSYFPNLDGLRSTQSEFSLADDSGRYQQVQVGTVQNIDAHVGKFDQDDKWRARVNEVDGKLTTSGSNLSNQLGKGQGLRSLADGLSYISSQSGRIFQNKRVGESSLLPDAIDGHEKQQCYFQGSGEHFDRGFPRSTNCVPLTVGSGLPSVSNPGYLPALPTAFVDKNIIDLSKNSQEENLKLLTLRNMAELSKQEHPITFQTNPLQGNMFSSSEMDLQKKVCKEHPESSRKSPLGALQTTIPAPPEGAIKQFQSCCPCHFTGSVEKLISLGGFGCCSFSLSAQAAPLCPNGIHHVADGQIPMLRLGRVENSNMAGSIVCDSCNQTQSNLPAGNLNCAVHSTCLPRNCILPRMHIDALKEHKSESLNRGLTEREIARSHGESSLKRSIITMKDTGTSQWKDVPTKATVCKDTQAGLVDQNHEVGGQISEITRKEYDAVTLEPEFLKEQQMSNVCSGSSAPVLTEVSMEVNGVSSIVDAGDYGSVQNLLIDEGSGTEKCNSEGSGKRIETLKAGYSSDFPNQSQFNLMEDLKLRNSSIRAKKDHIVHCEQEVRAGNRKRKTKWKKLDASTPVNNGLEIVGNRYSEDPLRTDGGSKKNCFLYSSGPSNVKRKRSAFLPQKVFKKMNLHKSEDHSCTYQEDDCDNELRCDSGPLGTDISSERRTKHGQISDMENAKPGEHQSRFSIFGKTQRLVVNGNLGIISNGKPSDGYIKPAKIVSLKSILKVAKRCTVDEHHPDADMGPTKRSRMISLNRIEEANHKISVQSGVVSEAHQTLVEESKKLSDASVKKSYGSKIKGCFVESSLSKKCPNDMVHNCSRHVTISGDSTIQTNPIVKESRKRSHFELTGKKQKAAKCIHLEGSDFASQADSFYSETACLEKSQCVENENAEACLPHSKKRTKSAPNRSELDVFCCVCGSAAKEEDNSLLECSSCLIRVHQACYGVSKVPKGRWCCRPCRANSKNIACVLCGYEGGAMTRALRSRGIVKSLLKLWKRDLLSETGKLESRVNLSSSTSQLGSSDTGSTMGLLNIETSPLAPRKRKLRGCSIKSSIVSCNFQVHNTITAGILDPTVTQWVHMVCGLWTPGTRCPNVDTMSAFDVSGASRVGKIVVCSMCCRPGGSCIKCRVVNCSIHFHPWCAHQKGLLQSEVEGVDNEKVGFYGRCLLHATNSSFHSANQILSVDADTQNLAEKEPTCARTEGFKGRKTGEALRHNLDSMSNDKSGCLVTQEQINAWLHINGQKLSSKGGLLKPITSDTEYDCRKEYSRYKQAKGWKHLVVYKSGIHALGLYTSKFIARGAMVVEYVGEIVGPRVADKRELEYQSGKKLQYKSACYFFRIDKEHIIDATRRGGIARFVNHSCLPNCVAKIISVRNEKKVVFFAERDINPGEEITYDYHFNHEDEGKKIPCLCKSKNCRRYLN